MRSERSMPIYLNKSRRNLSRHFGYVTCTDPLIFGACQSAHWLPIRGRLSLFNSHGQNLSGRQRQNV